MHRYRFRARFAALAALALAGAVAPSALAQPQPKLAIVDVTLVEGNSGITNATFFVSLSQASDQPVTVQFATQNGSAFGAPPAPEVGDYVPTSGALAIQPGDTLGAIAVQVRGDIIHEPNETFSVNLSSPVNATIDDGQGLATIVNDDPVPEVTIDNAVVFEGGRAEFTMSLSNPSSQGVSVQFATADGTAEGGSCSGTSCTGDYVASSAALGFSMNRGGSRTISIATVQDRSREPNETFFVNLTAASNATIADGQGVGTILNDDFFFN